METQASSRCGPPAGTVSSPGRVALTAGISLHAWERCPPRFCVTAWPGPHHQQPAGPPRMPAWDHPLPLPALV